MRCASSHSIARSILSQTAENGERNRHQGGRIQQGSHWAVWYRWVLSGAQTSSKNTLLRLMPLLMEHEMHEANTRALISTWIQSAKNEQNENGIKAQIQAMKSWRKKRKRKNKQRRWLKREKNECYSKGSEITYRLRQNDHVSSWSVIAVFIDFSSNAVVTDAVVVDCCFAFDFIFLSRKNSDLDFPHFSGFFIFTSIFVIILLIVFIRTHSWCSTFNVLWLICPLPYYAR